jgi:hypothetical protein
MELEELEIDQRSFSIANAQKTEDEEYAVTVFKYIN